MIRVCGLILFLIASFYTMGQESSVEITFELPASRGEWKIQTCKFYISDIAIEFQDESQFVLSDSSFLIDMLDSSNRTVLIEGLPDKKRKTLSFTFGTDSVTNVSGKFTGDLDPIHGMFWTWNSGYINLKLEGNKEDGVNRKSFEYHIGGYRNPYRTYRSCSFELSPDVRKVIITPNIINVLSRIEYLNVENVMSPGENAAEISEIFIEELGIE